jgi:hypothetical protein
VNLGTVTLADLAAGTLVTHWGYRERDLVPPVHDIADYDPDMHDQRDACYNLQLTLARTAGRNPNNHVVVEIRLADGTLVHAKFTDGNLRIAAGSVEVPERYR